jgi:hypothetical protein
MIDTVNGDFTSPYYIVSVPGNDSSYQLDFSTLNQLLKDTKTPEQTSRVVFWKILASGNSQVISSVQTSQLIVWNLSLNNENRPYKLINPMSNSVITLKGPGSTQLNFKWESTLTPVKNTEKYYLAFDTIGASPLFSNPVFQFEVPGDGEDTAINLTYGLIDRALDSVYGSNWGKVKLMWAAVAQINGTLYYPTSYNDVEFRTGLISTIAPAVTNDLSVYPNPAGEMVTLSMPVAGFSWSMCNAVGALVREGKTSGNEEQIRLTELKKGVYFIKVEQGGSFRNARILVTP